MQSGSWRFWPLANLRLEVLPPDALGHRFLDFARGCNAPRPMQLPYCPFPNTIKQKFWQWHWSFVGAFFVFVMGWAEEWLQLWGGCSQKCVFFVGCVRSPRRLGGRVSHRAVFAHKIQPPCRLIGAVHGPRSRTHLSTRRCLALTWLAALGVLHQQVAERCRNDTERTVASSGRQKWNSRRCEFLLTSVFAGWTLHHLYKAAKFGARGKNARRTTDPLGQPSCSEIVDKPSSHLFV